MLSSEPGTALRLLRRVLVITSLAAAGLTAGTPTATAGTMAVVVTGGSAASAADAVEQLGGSVAHELDALDAVAASVDAGALAALLASGFTVTPDVAVELTGADLTAATRDVHLEAMNPGPGWSPTGGAGVGVALVDTGVVATPDLAGRLFHGPDLSGEGDGVDRYGHGTFMAGLIAGDGTLSADSPVRHVGVAPGAHIVSLKVAGRDGSTSLGRILAAVDWAVTFRDDARLGVLNLSLGVVAGPGRDLLADAVEVAWASGLTVVVAAGNEGPGVVTSPGGSPWVITAGASDTNGTATTADDSLAPWSGTSAADSPAKPDVVAPGTSVVSLRAPGSTIDEAHPQGRVEDAYFRGSGTSMSTALTSGAAAAYLARHPDATPWAAKVALRTTADPIAGSEAGTVDLAETLEVTPVAGDTPDRRGNGAGRSRSSASPGGAWSGARWQGARWQGARWQGARWQHAPWEGARWQGARWQGARWQDDTWEGARWQGARWQGARWQGARWQGARWQGEGWEPAPSATAA